MRVLIIGPGYVGMQLAVELLAEGHEVFGLSRSAQANGRLSSAGIQPLSADITIAADLARLPLGWDWIVNCTSSSRGGADEYKNVYLRGTQNLLDWLSAAPPKKFVFTSSTSVYGQTGGEAVKESSPTEPASETGRILVATEQLLMRAAAKGFPAILVRIAGIYGPDRAYLLQQYLKNEARIAGAGDRILNMIHRHDVAGILKTVLKSGRAAETYNAVDDEPVAQIHFFRWLSETLGKWMPPFASDDENAARKRGLTNKRVQNRKVKMELGYVFKYPTFRQGYTAEIQRLDQAGELNIELEPR